MAGLVDTMLFGKQFAAVEFFSLNRKDTIAFLLVKKKGNELVIAQKEIYTSVDALHGQKSKLPTALIINNEQVLQKEIQGTDINDKKLLHKAFPNLQSDDFYYEIWRRGSSTLIAICRKSYVDQLLKGIEGQFGIAAISLGVCAIGTLSGFELPQTIATNTQVLALDAPENMLSNEVITHQEYAINDLDIPNTHLLPFCGVLSFLMPTATTGSLTSLGENLREMFKQKTFFSKGIQTAIGVLLALLLINFLLFSVYFNKASEMAETVSLNKAGIENLSKIKKRVKEKEQRLETFTGHVASASSRVINDLVKNMPASLLLSEITYHPLEKKIKDEEALTTTDSLVQVSGTSLSNSAFTGWVAELEKINWVKKVTIASYGKDAEGNTGFSISITIKK